MADRPKRHRRDKASDETNLTSTKQSGKARLPRASSATEVDETRSSSAALTIENHDDIAEVDKARSGAKHKHNRKRESRSRSAAPSTEIMQTDNGDQRETSKHRMERNRQEFKTSITGESRTVTQNIVRNKSARHTSTTAATEQG